MAECYLCGGVGSTIDHIPAAISLSCGQGRLGDDELLLFRDADVKMDFEAITRAWPEVDMGEAFRYRAQHSTEGSFIWFEFYRSTGGWPSPGTSRENTDVAKKQMILLKECGKRGTQECL